VQLGARMAHVTPRSLRPPVHWFNYYWRFYRSTLSSLAKRIDEHLVRWAMQKLKRLRRKAIRAWEWLKAAKRRQPKLSVHWYLLASPAGRSVGAV
jgi:hypothetical protein